MVPAAGSLSNPALTGYAPTELPVASTTTAGVDLAAEPAGTALAVIDWDNSAATLGDLRVGVSDSDIADAAASVSAIGIDCAFGWPDDFVEFIVGHSAGDRVDLSRDAGLAWRRRLAYRATDRDIRARTGRWPLSVATDRLGLTAMHCAALLDLIGERFGAVDRNGGGLAAEVYPGAMLRHWGFDTRGYKTEPAAREALISQLHSRAPWLDFEAFRPLMIQSDDAFDAVIAALGARANSLGQCPGAPEQFADQASREGWIRMPTTPLEALAPHTALAR